MSILGPDLSSCKSLECLVYRDKFSQAQFMQLATATLLTAMMWLTALSVPTKDVPELLYTNVLCILLLPMCPFSQFARGLMPGSHPDAPYLATRQSSHLRAADM